MHRHHPNLVHRSTEDVLRSETWRRSRKAVWLRSPIHRGHRRPSTPDKD